MIVIATRSGSIDAQPQSERDTDPYATPLHWSLLVGSNHLTILLHHQFTASLPHNFTTSLPRYLASSPARQLTSLPPYHLTTLPPTTSPPYHPPP